MINKPNNVKADYIFIKLHQHCLLNCLRDAPAIFFSLFNTNSVYDDNTFLVYITCLIYIELNNI